MLTWFGDTEHIKLPMAMAIVLLLYCGSGIFAIPVYGTVQHPLPWTAPRKRRRVS